MEAKNVRDLMGAYASIYEEKSKKSDCVDKEDKGAHNCAKKVCHEQFGEGTCIFGHHAIPDENGFVSHYDVIFEHGVEKNVPVSEMEVLISESHMKEGHHYEGEQLDEFLGPEAATMVDKATKAVQGGLQKLGMPINKTPRPTTTQAQQQAKVKQNVKEEDLFDLIKGHLISEGYADSEEAALKIMANMSEEWKESILDESRGADLRAKHGDNPSKKLETKAFRKAMSYDNRDRLPTGTGTEVRGRYLGLSGRARSRAGGETPASSAVGPRGESRRVRSRGGRPTGIGAGENRDRPTG